MTGSRFAIGRIVGAIFIANAVAGFSVTIVSATAARLLPIAAYAAFSVMTAIAMVASMALDFGLSTATLKRYSGSKDPGYLILYSRIRFAIFVGAIAFAAVLSLLQLTQWAFGIACGAGLALWTSTRTIDQMQQNYRDYLGHSLALGLLRLTLGIAAIVTRRPGLIAVAIFVVPVVLVVIRGDALSSILKPQPLPHIRTLSGYASATYVSALTYSAALYIPQYIAKLRLAPIDVSELGLILSLMGPLSLVNASFRIYLLPKFAGNDNWFSSLGTRRVAGAFGLFGIVGLAVIAGVAIFLQLIYGDRFPSIGAAYASFAGPYILVTMLGFFNVRVHQVGIPGREAMVNILRLLSLIVFVPILATSLFPLIWASIGIITLFEVLLTIIVASSVRRTAR
jgi:O-antigen/teichoic acid export membrane protein